MAKHHRRRSLLVLAGFGLGLVVVLAALYVYFRTATDTRLAEGVLRTVQLPAEVMRVEALEGDSVARVALRDVEFLDEAGETVATAPLVRMVVDLNSFAGDGPIALREVLVSQPTLNYVQFADGGSNLESIVRVTAGGREVDTGEAGGRGVVIRDLRIAGGDVRWSSPYVADSLPIAPRARAAIRLARVGGTVMRVRSVRDLDLWVSSARFGGDEGWSVEVASGRARLTDPEMRVVALAGSARQEADEAIRFDLNTLRTDRSVLAGAGTVRLGGETQEFDVQLRADPLDFADLRWFVPSVPEGGRAAGTFALASRPNGQTAVSARDLVVTAFDSRVTGRFSALVGGELPASFWDTRLMLDPLRLRTLEQLGLAEDIPYAGEIRGSLAADAGTAGAAVPLRVDLTATFAPEGSDVPVSTVHATGPVRLGEKNVPIRFAGVEVVFQPLHLAALRPIAPPEQHERLRGTLRGAATLTGTPQSLRVEGGDLAYQVGDAPRSRLTGLSLSLETQPEMSFVLEARAAPLALGTLAELFPAFPFRTASFAGPIRIEGTASQFRIDTELSGAAGLIALRGTVSPGEVLRFDLTGRVAALNTQAVMDRPSPVQGPVTGTFAAAGSAEDFHFDVDLLQEGGDAAGGEGRFALEGRFRKPTGGEAQVDVAGNITNFNLGALIGRPGLFPSRMTGAVQVSGGGRDPYRFDLDLRGASGALDVEGWYASGPIPSYQIVGTVAGLDLRQLPRGESLPQTSLNATIDLRGQGTTLETLAGDFEIDASRSTISGKPLDALRADLSIRDGVAVVDTLAVALAGTRLRASGTWGLTRSTPSPLRFQLVSEDLSQLAPFLPDVQGVDPQLTGSFVLEGTVAGSVKVPVVDVAFQGDDLRYEGWRARELEFDLAATLGRRIEEITGELALSGEELELAGRTSLLSLRLGLEGGGNRVAIRAAADRTEDAGIALTGTLELDGSTPRAVLLDSLAVRAGDAAWRLANSAEVRWGGVEGTRVSNLLLRRVGDETGSIAINGTIPPTGASELRVAVENLDLAFLRRLVPTAPELAGVVRLNAVLQGPVTDPELTVDGSITRFVYQGVAADSISLTGRYDDRIFNTTAAVWTAGVQVGLADAAIPARLAFENSFPAFEVLRTEPLRARIVSDSLAIALLTSSSRLVRDAAGVVSTEIAITGTVDRPQMSGWTRVIDGAATFEQLGVRYEEINGRFSYDGEVVRIDTLTVRSDGTASATGTIRLADLDRPELYLTATMDGFEAIKNDELAELTMSGTVALTGRMPQPVLTGQVALQRGVIYLPDYSEQIPLELTELDVGQLGPDSTIAVSPTFAENVQINSLEVEVQEGVWFQTRDARVEIRGQLVVFRSGTQPRIYGNLQAVRGTYALTIGPIVRQFDVISGSVRFFGTQDLNPELDITAEHEVRSGAGTGGQSTLSILVRVTGTAEFPKVALTSDTRPPLPESELLNYLVFGQPSFRLTQQQGFAQQLLVQEFLGGILVQELGHLGLPCEYLRMRGRPTEITIGSPLAGFGATSLECGVQVLPDVFLTLETGVASAMNPSNPLNALLGVSVDWQISDYVAARVAREPVRSGIGGLLFQSSDIPYQWSTDLNGTWEFARPENAPSMEPEVEEPTLPGRVAPAPARSPSEAPLETPREATPAGSPAAVAKTEESASPL